MLDALFRLLVDHPLNEYLIALGIFAIFAIVVILLTFVLLQVAGVLLLHWKQVATKGLVGLVIWALAANISNFLSQDPCMDGLRNIEVFENIVPDHIWGQPVATEMVVEAVKAHRTALNRKPLVLSLHGGTGTGKTALSLLLARTMFGYKDGEPFGTSGVYVIGKPVGASNEEYKEYIRTTLDGALRSGSGSLFVFERMKSVPGNIGQLLKTILEDSEHNYPCKDETIFLLSTHIGSKNLEDVALDSWKHGIDRDRIDHRELQAAISTASGDNETDRWHRRMTEHGLITKSIPFLPLDRSTVRRCIVHEMPYLPHVNENKKLADVRYAMGLRNFHASGSIVFAKKGCANISLTVP
ncbi:torsin-1A-like [Mya arenaria]|uniref:torsin-1A-like n=1 Tax=Mya arenaria TaxID=6604 RepID=UPI0022E7CE73|nr:torsin-1A-like [Mya arenaria]